MPMSSLVSTLSAKGGLVQLERVSEIGALVEEILDDETMGERLCNRATEVLRAHGGATERSIEVLRGIAWTM